MKHRFIIRIHNKHKNFLTLEETRNRDLIISQRGRYFSGLIGEFSTEKKSEKVSSITVHPSLKSESITINYKYQAGGLETRKIAHVLEIKNGNRLYPVYASIGRNVDSPTCDLAESKLKKAQLIELWPETEIDFMKKSLAFILYVASPKFDFVLPEDLPLKVKKIKFTHFQIVVFYWLINLPTKEYWSNFLPFLGDKVYQNGQNLDEVLEYVKDTSLRHLEHYESLPS